MVSDSGKNFSKEQREILVIELKTSKRRSGTTKRNLKIFQPNSPHISTMGYKDKDKENSDAKAMGIMGEDAKTAHKACQAAWDLSHERAATIDKLIAEAITRESSQLTVTFTAILNQNSAANMPASLKVTSRAAGIKAMSTFDWTKDKSIYQRWQLWSEKARHILDCMEGDSVKTKISYFHHWIDSPGMAHI